MAKTPYKVSWYLENRVLEISVNAVMSPEETRQMEDDAFQYIKKAPGKIHAIVDLRGLSDRPPHMHEAFGQINAPKHQNQGTSVIITPMNPIVKFICSTILNNMELHFKFCSDYEEAEKIIAKLEKKRPKGGTV